MVYRFLLAFLLATTAWSDLSPPKYHEKQRLAVPPVEVHRTKDCPAGFELVGKQCISSEVIAPHLVCPQSTSPLNDDCVSFAKALRVCSKGTQSAGDQCVSTQVIEASQICDEGEIEGGRCRVARSVPPTCPAGYQLRDSHCVRFTSPQKACDVGYVLQGKDCVRPVSFAAAPVCPPSFSLVENDRCTKSIPVPPRCKVGFSLVAGECVKDISKVPAPCPDGFTPVGGVCRRADEFPTRPVCPDDFVLDTSNQCVKEVPVPPTCPAGTSRGSSGECERPVSKKPFCEDGEDLVGSQCVRKSVFGSQLVCSEGFTLIHEKCKKVYVEDPFPFCPVGVLQGGQCNVHSSASPVVQCPFGYQMSKGDRCVRDVAYDCSTSIVRTECEMPLFVSQLAEIRRLNGDYKVKSRPPPQLKAAKEDSKTPACSPVTRVVPQTCTKSETVAVQKVCPDGSSPVGKSCNIVTLVPAEENCRHGQRDKATGKCVTIDVRAASTVCSTGTLQSDASCLLVEEKEAALVCPDYSVPSGGNCYVTMPEILHPNQVFRRTPQAVCDFGVKQGVVCVQTTEVPRGEVCPSGSEDRAGHCVVTSPVVAPEAVVVNRAAHYVCPPGSSLADKSCSNTDVVEAADVCPDGTEREGSRCASVAQLRHSPLRVSHSPVRRVCPAGYKQQDDQCSLTTAEPANLQCPSGFARFRDGVQECIRSYQRVSVCPVGTETSAKGCIKKSYVPPRVTEIKTCIKGQC